MRIQKWKNKKPKTENQKWKNKKQKNKKTEKSKIEMPKKQKTKTEKQKRKKQKRKKQKIKNKLLKINSKLVLNIIKAISPRLKSEILNEIIRLILSKAELVFNIFDNNSCFWKTFIKLFH